LRSDDNYAETELFITPYKYLIRNNYLIYRGFKVPNLTLLLLDYQTNVL